MTYYNTCTFYSCAAFRHSPRRRDHVCQRQHERVVLLACHATTPAAACGRHKLGRRFPREQNPSKYYRNVHDVKGLCLTGLLSLLLLLFYK